MNRAQRRKIKRSANLKLLFFTFFGAFILFFVAFTQILPMVTPKVEIPALTEDHVFNSITSHDFRGRIDPRLHSIELQEQIPPKMQNDKKEEKKEISTPSDATIDGISNEDKWHNQEEQTQESREVPLPKKKQASSQEESTVNVNVPPRPRPILSGKKVAIIPPAPVFKAKVIVGDYSSPNEAKITSDILLNLDYEPFIRERNGKYIIQVGSFSETEKAKSLVNELKNRNFDARIIYE